MTSVDSSDIPAGFFSTFSIADPYNPAPGNIVKAQKRNRRVFVCIPCHRRKLKCDKLLPCSRCVAAEIADECTYMPPPSPPAKADKSRKKRDRMITTRSGRTVKETTKSRQTKFHESIPYLFGTDLQWQQRYCRVKSLKCLFPSLNDNINFPFSNTNAASKDQILTSLPPNHIVETLITHYFDTFGATHGLFHPAQLQYEVRQFYDAPSDVSDEWLAQFCMILALGAESTSDFLFSGSGQSAAGWASVFLNSAQASFGRSSYMVAPTLTTVRTLCMMVLAKLIEAPASGGSCSGSSGGGSNNYSGGAEDSSSKPFTTNGYAPLVSLMAFTMRIATSLQLHRSLTASTAAGKQTLSAPIDVEMRRRVWVTVRLLDLDTALRAGTMAMQRHGACDMEPPQSLPGASISCRSDGHATVYNPLKCDHSIVCEEAGYLGAVFKNDYGYGDDQKLPATTTLPNAGDPSKAFQGDPDGLYQHTLATILPLLSSIVDASNSPTKPSPDHEHIKAWDGRVRRFLGDAKTSLHSDYGIFDTDISAGQVQRATIQYQYLETLAHRVLLALHHDAFCQSLSPSMTSHFKGLSSMAQAAVVESSLALLDTHKTWAAAVINLAGRCPSTCTNMTTGATATATVPSVDTPFTSMLHLPGGGGGSLFDIIKPTAAEMILYQQQQQHLSISGRSSPTLFGGSTDVTSLTPMVPAITTNAPTATTPPPPVINTGRLLDLCHDDFGAALIYMVLVLRAVHGQGKTGLLGSPNEEAAAVTAIRHSYQIMRDRSYLSVAHFKEFLGVAILFACFRGLRSGDMLAQVVDATNDVEQVVVAGRRYLSWVADSFAPMADDAALIFNPPLIYGM
ncbi:hypothetical protein SEUCBS140593_006541 [Sporothrix eucalyptigena]|uniref:Zn(2)-C6 fungal-type domain-containing protein n=1 Tax=Sporothrix eucalyptigena TaxID=1812306 RepID=A0ABP0C5P4_9PEZI